ncbi:MAG: hypothetical protein WBZ20_16525 [Nitrososphaeraceae archaeon]
MLLQEKDNNIVDTYFCFAVGAFAKAAPTIPFSYLPICKVHAIFLVDAVLYGSIQTWDSE